MIFWYVHSQAQFGTCLAVEFFGGLTAAMLCGFLNVVLPKSLMSCLRQGAGQNVIKDCHRPGFRQSKACQMARFQDTIGVCEAQTPRGSAFDDEDPKAWLPLGAAAANIGVDRKDRLGK